MTVVISAIVKLVIIALFGFLLYRKNILKDESLRFVTVFVVNFSVPFLIFSRIIDNFHKEFIPSPVFFILVSIGIFILGISVSLLFGVFIKKPLRREFISLISFQNCGYLPMNIAFMLLPSLLREEFLLYVFFYILGFNILMWSLGSFLIYKTAKDKFIWRTLFTPPIISVILGIFVIYFDIEKFIPEVIIAPIRMIGNTSFVFSMLILGGWLAKGRIHNVTSHLRFHFMVNILKLIVLPLVMLVIVIKFNLYSLLGLFLILEAAMPSAASLPIVSSWYDVNTEVVAQGVLVTHVVSIITVPLWIEVFLKISGYTF